ncbi:DNA-directed RNA polymerases i, ii, and iii 145 kDa polypeptide [Bisporella sp. PMI_857]|nr:DNA-directed RNA polymerases i, ii, and iii 145 kDa polypeptide [Bisporella sp. PMI_857]
MSTNPDASLLEDTFIITAINAEKYDRVSRLTLQSEDALTSMTLDINSELYPCHTGEKLHILCSTSLSLDGSKEEKGWRDVARAGAGETTLADMYDYVCHGKVYKFEEDPEAKSIKAFVSFGGLLMAVEGDYKKLQTLRVEHCYLLMKK